MGGGGGGGGTRACGGLSLWQAEGDIVGYGVGGLRVQGFQ